MAKKARSAPAPAPEPVADPVAESIDRLTGEIGLLREVIDEFREDFSWLTRNGLPVQPVEHIILHKLPLDLSDPKWNEKVQLERFTVPSDPSESLLDSHVLDRIAEDLKASFEAVAQGQLEVVLTALDGVRGEIMAALRRKADGSAGNKPPVMVPVARTVPAPEPKVDPPPPEPRREPPQKGRLF
jgi:hypothetical protein